MNRVDYLEIAGLVAIFLSVITLYFLSTDFTDSQEDRNLAILEEMNSQIANLEISKSYLLEKSSPAVIHHRAMD